MPLPSLVFGSRQHLSEDKIVVETFALSRLWIAKLSLMWQLGLSWYIRGVLVLSVGTFLQALCAQALAGER